MIFIKKGILISSLVFLLVIIFCFITKKGLLNSLDNNICDFFVDIRGSKGNPLYWTLRVLTEFGYYYFVIIIIILLAIWFRIGYRTFIITISVGGNAILNAILKHFVARPRPSESLRWMRETSYSFPSGHSTTAFCFYMLIMLVVIKTIPNIKAKRAISIICPIIVLIVGISRLVMGVHYFTDVLGGFLVGAFTIIVANIVLNYFINKKKEIKE